MPTRKTRSLHPPVRQNVANGKPWRGMNGNHNGEKLLTGGEKTWGSHTQSWGSPPAAPRAFMSPAALARHADYGMPMSWQEHLPGKNRAWRIGRLRQAVGLRIRRKSQAGRRRMRAADNRQRGRPAASVRWRMGGWRQPLRCGTAQGPGGAWRPGLSAQMRHINIQAPGNDLLAMGKLPNPAAMVNRARRHRSPIRARQRAGSPGKRAGHHENPEKQRNAADQCRHDRFRQQVTICRLLQQEEHDTNSPEQSRTRGQPERRFLEMDHFSFSSSLKSAFFPASRSPSGAG